MKRKEKKVNDNSTTVKYTTKSLNWLNDPVLVMQRITADFTEDNAKEVASCILEWSARDDAWNLHQFCDLMIMPRETFESRAERWPILKYAYDIARGRLAERRERKAVFKEYETDATMIKPTLRFYDYDHQRKYKEDRDLESQRRIEDHERRLREITARADAAEKEVEVFKKKLFELNPMGVKSDEDQTASGNKE